MSLETRPSKAVDYIGLVPRVAGWDKEAGGSR
jgi:hypothetical protein